MFRPDFTSEDNVAILPSRSSVGEGSTQGSPMSDVSSGHTEIIPSQSSPSDSHWSFDRNDDDDDPRYAEMRSNRSSSSGSVWSYRDEGQVDDSLDEESDGRLAEDDDNFDEENDGHQAKDREGEDNSRLPDGVEPVPDSKSVTYRGHTYAFYNGGESTTNYRCSAYRRTGCFVKLKVSRRGVVVEGRHKSDCVPELVQAPDGPAPVVVNRKQQMLLATDEVGIQDVTLTPERVWEIIRDRFYGDENVVVQGATKKQILGRLYRTRSKHFGREIFGRLEMEPLCDVKHSPGLKFFQFHLTYYEDEVLHRIIGWAHPKLMDRMKQRQSSLFIDATYRCVPIRFYQLVIVMMYDPISDLYLPIWYAPTSGKTARVYELLFNYICVASKNRLDPVHVVCDFEYAMIKTVKNQFPNSRIVGCLFHFKQALRRKMLKLNIPEGEVSLAMREGCIDRLTVIRRCDIVFRGVQDVRRMIKRDCGDQGIAYSKDNWKKFWKYFKRTWIKKFAPEWWNVNGLNEDIVNRTNNPLERYNRTLNEAFPVPHPDVIQFISVIERQSRENVCLIEDISNRRARAPEHADPQQAPRFESDSDFVDDSGLDASDSDGDEDSNSDHSMGMSPEY